MYDQHGSPSIPPPCPFHTPSAPPPLDEPRQSEYSTNKGVGAGRSLLHLLVVPKKLQPVPFHCEWRKTRSSASREKTERRRMLLRPEDNTKPIPVTWRPGLRPW